MSDFKLDFHEEIKHFEDIWASRPPVDEKVLHSKEKWDERAHNWAKELELDDYKKRSDERTSATATYLRNHGVLGPDFNVIDIGCGLGRFVVEFAKSAKHVTGCDLSPQMCIYGKQYAKQSKVEEKTTWIDCNFKYVDLEKMGWNKAFDLVFTSLTPAIDGVDAIDKLCEMSRAYCFNCSFVKEQDDLDDMIYKKITGKEIPQKFQSHLHWYYSLYNILLLKGYLPRTDFYEENWTTYVDASAESVEYFVEKLKSKYKLEDVNYKMLKTILQNLADNDGKIEYNHSIIYGFMLWNVNGQV